MCQILQESISEYAWVLTGRKSFKTPQGGLVVITRSIRGVQVWEIFLQSPGKGTQIFHICSLLPKGGYIFMCWNLPLFVLACSRCACTNWMTIHSTVEYIASASSIWSLPVCVTEDKKVWETLSCVMWEGTWYWVYKTGSVDRSWWCLANVVVSRVSPKEGKGLVNYVYNIIQGTCRCTVWYNPFMLQYFGTCQWWQIYNIMFQYGN